MEDEMKYLLAVACLLAALSTCPAYEPKLPAGATQYTSTTITQSIFVLDERDTIRPVSIMELPDLRWHQPGGLENVKRDEYTAVKYRFVPQAARQTFRQRIANIGVRNSFGHVQQNRGIVRDYPIGTRFDELLVNTKSSEVFEHRIREKLTTGWTSYVEHEDIEARPTGYTGLKVSCASCHNEAGSGGYAVGLVPGGDTVLSDPLDWSLVSAPAPGGWGPPAPKAEPTPMAVPAPKSQSCPLGKPCPQATQAAPTVTRTIIVQPRKRLFFRGLRG